MVTGVTSSIRRHGPVALAAILLALLAAALTGVLAPAASAAPDATQIDAFLQRRGSPMAGLGATFISQGETYGVNPLFLVAVSGAESSFGLYLYSEGGDEATFNAFNWFYGPTRASSDFTSWDEAIARVAAGISGDLYFGSGLYSVDSIGPKYCPDGTANWIDNVKAFMNELGADPADVRIAATGLPAEISTTPTPTPSPTGAGVVALGSSVELDRGDRWVGQRIYAWFTLTNTGGEPVTVDGIRLAIEAPSETRRDLVSDQPLTLQPGQESQVCAIWPLDLLGRWKGWVEVTQNGQAIVVGDPQAFAFWVKLPKDVQARRWSLRDAALDVVSR